MSLVHAVPSCHRPVERLASVVGAERYGQLQSAAQDFRTRFAGRTVWNVSSTAVGGGVAEMLHALVGYVEDLGITIRWLVIHGDAEFFAITKRVHNRIHGSGDRASLGDAEADHYQRVLSANAVELVQRIRPGDIVLLHDPQTAGLAAPLGEAGALVVWRCHIGLDTVNDVTDSAWAFLRPYVDAADACVFSRRSYVPSWLTGKDVWVVPPSIDSFSVKNQDMDPETVRAILGTIGIVDAPAGDRGRFVRPDGRPGEVVRSAAVVADALPGVDDNLVVQVSRWDRLKDMQGVMSAWARHVAPDHSGYLALVGPAV